MNYILSLLEFNNKHKNIILENESNFTIAYELELMSKKAFNTFEELDKHFRKYYKPIITKYNMVTEYDYTVDQQFNDDLYNSNIYEFYADINMDMDMNQSRVKGIEMKNKTYFNGINKAFEFLDEFYLVLKNKEFKQTNTTGTHINIGYNNDNDWNILKGYLLLNEDFAFKGFENRKGSEFTGSYRKLFNYEVKKYIKNKFGEEYRVNHLEIRDNIAIFEKDLNNILISIIKKIGEKKVGFNINKLKSNYIEFRYPGGSIQKDTLKEQTLHYSNIVYLCKEPSYRRKDYIKRLINLIINT